MNIIGDLTLGKLLAVMFILFLILGMPKILQWFKNKKTMSVLAGSGIRDIDKMDGFQFEVYLKALLKKMGYKPMVTSKSHDYGADVILEGKNRIVIQAKRYGVKNKVGVDAVFQALGARFCYDAKESWIITNSQFTKNAKWAAEKCNVRLIDRLKLQELIVEVNPEVTPKQVYEVVEPAARKCPKCKSELILRNRNTQKQFFGCSRYPHCKHTESINSRN
ncbi:restriction endonuclease [Bacillus sp. FSL M8-0168]|uniref:restriction endonuclease n=1 Tax=Bacillus sp. FSL M8-0168 TaxID=2921614 RepID=UPI0030FDCC63